MTPELVEAFRVPPRRTRIPDLHGPRGRGGVADEPPTEVWSHGQLVAVDSDERRAELSARWGAERCEDAAVGPVAAPEITRGDRRLAGRLPPGTRVLRRAFRHAGCKAAQLGALEPGALREFGPLGGALAHDGRPRDAVLAELIGDDDSTISDWIARVDALDRELDGWAGGDSWAMAQVPAHCRALGPLRNLLRAADRRGVVFRAMRFADFEAEDRFVPELPVVCLDHEIHGGGFDHDLFHACVPTLATTDRLAFEATMLGVEAAGQAFNSAVLAARHTGPAYDGWATWPGARLFDELASATGLTSLPEQIRAYAILGLVGHPDFEPDAAGATFADLVGAGHAGRLGELTDANRRYLVRDAGWLRGLWPRYGSPIFEAWRPALQDRLIGTPAGLFARLDLLLDELEDLDLRTLDHELVGRTSRAREDARRTALKALELDLLLTRGGDHSGRVTLAPALGQALALVESLGEAVAVTDGITRLPLGETREQLARAREEELAQLTTRCESVRRAVEAAASAAAARQRAGALEGPRVPDRFLDHTGELFDRVFYEPPVHVGADWPWVSDRE